MSTLVNYTKFISTGIRPTKADKHSFEKPVEGDELTPEGKPKMQTITYWKIPFEYREQLCDASGNPLVSSTGAPLFSVSNLLLEGPKVVCNGGIRTDRKGSKDVHSMVWQYDLNDPNVDRFCGRRVDLKHIVMKLLQAGKLEDQSAWDEEEKNLSCLERLQLAAIRLIMANSKEHGLKGAIWQILNCLSRPVAWKKIEDESGDAIPGKNPYHFVDLMHYGRGASAAKTIFTLPDGTVLDWDADPNVPSVLRGVKVEFIPTFKCGITILANGNASIKMVLMSAVVTGLVKQTIESLQTATMSSLSKEDGLVDKLRKQVEALTAQLGKKIEEEPKESPKLSDVSFVPLPPSGGSGGARSSDTPPLPAGLPGMTSLSAMLGRGPTIQSST